MSLKRKSIISREDEKGLSEQIKTVPVSSGKASATPQPEESSLLCGFFGWSPGWLQMFNNMKAFMLCFVLLSIFRGMSFSYFASMVPSIEKRFGLSSQSIGTVRAMSDVSQLLSALVVAHFGGAGHRPRWIAGGSLLVGLGFLLMASPEIFFPPSLTSSLATVLATSSDKKEPFCDAGRNGSSRAASLDCSKSDNDRIGPLIVLGFAEFIMGLGATTASILGMPFVDDNVKNKNTPLYFALSFAGFIFGPLIGTALSAVFNTIYFDFSHPDFKPSDPRWISAWYLGFIIAGLGVMVMALLISCFPSVLAKTSKKLPAIKMEHELQQQPSEITLNVPEPKAPYKSPPVTLKDLPVNLLRLLKNYTYVIKLFGQLISAFAMSGYMSFMTKFMKEQYQLPQSIINLAGSLPPICGWLVGVSLGSIFIRYFKLCPRQICYVMATCSLLGSACFFAVMALGCDKEPIVGVDDVLDPYNMTSADVCMNDRNCNCLDFQFSPICDKATGKTYVSACTAGCRTASRINSTKYYYDCICVTQQNETSAPPSFELKFWNASTTISNGGKSEIISGVCPKHCSNFVIYVVVMTISTLCFAFPVSGVLMLQFRIVDVDLKSLASGVTTVVMSAFGMLPAPIVLGKLIDSSCRLWQIDSCGTRGACWIYNADEFRWKLHAIVGASRLINCLVDLTIAYRVWSLSFDRGEPSAAGSIRRKSLRESSTSQVDLIKDENGEPATDDEYPAEIQRGEVFAEARRRSIFIHDAVIS
ncbi:Solute carrier organic anion transporter family member 4C1 [Hypsibius exemplaris]|uniref:Solute carrier organic anion transporter family member n=1 Tax=Hypsibius exemplaris TaxID=2072580 RepID=A0A1W0WJU2_HYPEX|nr:Solute carrier organic anion transporter family member 4C1 [Hypsibius exemplaris]